MINGVINIYKEAGFTSFDVVARLRRILKIKKIGHTGTLDPDAVGVLPVCVGNATKLVDMLTDETKEYRAVMRLGVVTNTQDMSGEILFENEEDAKKVTFEEIEKAVLSFSGDILQVPPMYSALKVNGQKLYDLARKGIEVERKPRPVCIHNISVSLTDNALEYELLVECSKGTYIRTLIHDIGQKLGCGASMKHLERTRVGRFSVNDALKLSKVEELVNSEKTDMFVPVDVILDKYKAFRINEEGIKALDNGNQLMPFQIADIDVDTILNQEMFRVYDTENIFRAVYVFNQRRKCFEVSKMFI